MMFQTAYQANAPCGLNAFRRLGQVTLRTKLKNQVVAVARLIPKGRMYSGYASAEYVNGTGPSPGESNGVLMYVTPKKEKKLTNDTKEVQA
jgi:hypothetical protein